LFSKLIFPGMLIACVVARRVSVDEKRQISRFEPAIESVFFKCGSDSQPIRAGSHRFISILEDANAQVVISVTLNGKTFCDFSVRSDAFPQDSLLSGYLPIPTDAVTPGALLTARQALRLPHRALVARLAIGTGAQLDRRFEQFAQLSEDLAIKEAFLEEQLPRKMRSSGALREVMNSCKLALAACRHRDCGVQTEETGIDGEMEELRARLYISEKRLQQVMEARDAEMFQVTRELSQMRIEAERSLSNENRLITEKVNYPS
jgi:hypothetical protein